MTLRGHLLFMLYAILVFCFIVGVFLTGKIYRRRRSSRHPRHSVRLRREAYWYIADKDAEQGLLEKPRVRKLNAGLTEDQEASLLGRLWQATIRYGRKH